MDRSDLQFAAKELCRKMAKPEPMDWDKAKRIARYLEFPCRQRLGRREALHESTSGGALKWGASTLKSWSSMQTAIALSLVEAELHAMSKCA